LVKRVKTPLPSPLDEKGGNKRIVVSIRGFLPTGAKKPLK